MAAKRSATTELDHDNWDVEEESEEAGVFRTASKEELQRRVIRTGRRRVQPGSVKQDNKNTFSTFSGFNKTAPTSFDFLSNLTNGKGTSTANGSSTPNRDSASSGGMFVCPPIASSTTIGSPLTNDESKLTSNNNNTGKFGAPTSTINSGSSFVATQNTTSPSNDNKPAFMFGISSPSTITPKPAMFGIPSMVSPPTVSESKSTSVFGAQSTGSIVSSNVLPTFMFGNATKTSPNITDSKSHSVPMFDISKANSQSTSNSKPAMTFGSQPHNPENKNNSVFGTSTNPSSPTSSFKLPTTLTSMLSTGTKSTTDSIPSKRVKSDDNVNADVIGDKTQYYSKLKGLNESVSEWIRKHVNENPLCILTPIFKDYEKYLKELEEEHSKEGSTHNVEARATIEKNEATSSTNTSSSIFTNKSAGIPSANFSLQKVSEPAVSTTNSSVPFSFGTISTKPGMNAASTPFSFGISNTFTFNAQNVQKPSEQAEEKKEDEDEPPKVEYNPITEENSVFDKKCKIFFKKDDNFVDKGVGTLYIKTVENSSKHQLIVRANTSLGTILVNFILSDSTPTQRMGKNNVMVVCLPTPDSKPPPVPVLIRVKTSEEADDLLETLDKYKK